MKKVITLLLAVCLVMTMAVPAFSAETEEVEVGTAGGFIYANPIYGELSEEDFADIEPIGFLAGSSVGFEGAVVQFREAMKARAQSFNISLEVTVQEAEAAGGINQLLHNIHEKALVHTGDPSEGDYILFNLKGYELAPTTIYQTGNVLRATLPYYAKYNTDFDMEEAVGEKIEEILEGLNLAGKTDYQKIKAIYDYLCENVDYAHDHLTVCAGGGCTGYEHSAHAALIEGESVCQGYTLALYRMALEAGVDARCIAGIGYGDGINPENHAWNIVKLGDYYYNADATWDATVAEYGGEYEYFLCSDSNFVNHVKNGEAGVSIQGYPDYTSAEFNAAHLMAASNFDPSAEAIIPGLSITSAEGAIKGETTVSVNISENSNAAVLQFALKFDPTKLQVVSYSVGEAMNGFDKPVVREDNTEGLVYFAWEELEGLTEGGSVLDVTFKVLEAAETGEELAVKFANGTDGGEETVIGSFSGIDSDGEPEYAPMEAETTNGVITATKVILLGDVNQDGFLDFSDLQRLFMHLSGGEPLTGDGLAVANTNQLDDIDFADLQFLYQQLIA
ncbi:MAG: hypothetical protein IJD62_01225 [Oscillospiraceae bacterium]|nr:hypothetical protein [Oscillospiraceae bacterium]